MEPFEADTFSFLFMAPGPYFRVAQKSNRELEQFSVDETADRAESLTENLNSFRPTYLPTARKSNRELEQFSVGSFPFSWPLGLIFQVARNVS